MFLLTLLPWLLHGKYKAEGIEIQTKLGSAVHFALPEVNTCATYNLTNPQKENVITVYNSSHSLISNVYRGRSTNQSLENGTVLFTLHHIQNSDEGTYLVEPGGQSPDICWKMFVLTIIRDSKSTGYWLGWEPWSGCDKTCGEATRVRLRECSIPNYCFHGDSREMSLCSENPLCYEWSLWSDWSDCSVTCGDGLQDRHRFCFTHGHRRTADEHCSGATYERQECALKQCLVHQPVIYKWSHWESWSICSQSCGTGYMTRLRQCHDGQETVHSDRCIGLQLENRNCSLSRCEEDGAETGSEDTGNSEDMLNTSDRTVQLPLSAIVGSGAGIFILILTIIICVLFIKLRRKKQILGVVKTGSVKQNNIVSNKMKKEKRASIISSSSVGVSGVHVYDEINSDDVKSQRMSVLTIDNPYVMLPKSASPSGPKDFQTGAVHYSNTEETVFVFDNNTGGQGKYQGHGQNRKVSNAYKNNGNSLTVPRHMSIDSTGYLMPGNAMERAAKRNMKYTKNT